MLQINYWIFGNAENGSFPLCRFETVNHAWIWFYPMTMIDECFAEFGRLILKFSKIQIYITLWRVEILRGEIKFKVFIVVEV